jgi:methyl-accepting chemotaxis protein
MKPLYTKNKIYLIFAGLAGFFFLFAMLLLNQAESMKQQSTEIQTNWMPSIVAVNGINTATSDYRITEAMHIISPDIDAKSQYDRQLDQISREIGGLQSRYEVMISSEQERVIYQRFDKNFDKYLLSSKQTIELSENNDTARATAQLKRTGALFNEFSDDLLKLVQLNNEGSIATAKKSDTIFKQAKTVIVAGSILVTIVSIVIMFMLIANLNTKGKLTLAKSTDTGNSVTKFKIIAAFLTINLGFLVFSGVFYKQLENVNKQITELNQNWLPSIVAVNAIDTLTSDFRGSGMLHIMTTDAAGMAQVEKDRKVIYDGLVSWNKKYQPMISSERESELYKEFLQSYDEYMATAKEVLTLSRNNEKQKAITLTKQNGIVFEDFKANLASLIEINEKGGINSSHQVDGTFNMLKIITIGGSLFMLTIIIISAQLIESWILAKPEIIVTLQSEQPEPFFSISIKTKLRIAFLGMAMVFIVFGVVVSSLIENINKEANDMGTNWMPSIIAINTINKAVSDYRINEAQHVLATDPVKQLEAEKIRTRLLRKIAKLRQSYELLISSEEERAIYNETVRRFYDYMSGSDKTLALSRNNDKAQAAIEMQRNQVAYKSFMFNLNKLVQINQAGGTEASQRSGRVFNESQQIIVMVGMVIFMAAVIFMIVFDKNIAKPLQRLTGVIQRLSMGNITLGNDFENRYDEVGKMAAAISQVTETLLTLTRDSIDLIEAAQAGILSARAETKRHPGEFGRIVFGMNQLLDVLTAPLTEIAQIMQNLALGDLAGRVKGEYEGELRTLKANVNRSLDALVNLLSELGNTTKHMAEGDLTHLLAGNYQGEFSVLKANTNQTIMKMTEILQEITTNTNNSAVAITQTSEASKYVAKEASLQMFALDEVVRTIDETASSINEVAHSATKGNELACTTAALAKNGEQQLHKLIELIRHVDSEFSKIEHITGEITRIADKTHLLSLNAGLEAMRAGEHGVGFGFVAQQIGKLAEEVSVSARDIGTVIGSSAQSVRVGVNATEETRTAMAQIAEAAQTSEHTAQGISAAIVEQSAAVKSLSERINDIQSSSKATASSAEEISATMIHLAETVRQTAAQTQRFTLAEK